jgi:hypothetical protein
VSAQRPARWDLSLYDGDSLNETFTFYTDDTTLMNLTGYTAEFIVKTREAGDTIATLTSGSGITLGGTAGTVKIVASYSTVSGWKLDKGYYKLRLTSGDGTRKTYTEGDLEIVNT